MCNNRIIFEPLLAYLGEWNALLMFSYYFKGISPIYYESTLCTEEFLTHKKEYDEILKEIPKLKEAHERIEFNSLHPILDYHHYPEIINSEDIRLIFLDEIFSPFFNDGKRSLDATFSFLEGAYFSMCIEEDEIAGVFLDLVKNNLNKKKNKSGIINFDEEYMRLLPSVESYYGSFILNWFRARKSENPEDKKRYASLAMLDNLRGANKYFRRETDQDFNFTTVPALAMAAEFDISPSWTENACKYGLQLICEDSMHRNYHTALSRGWLLQKPEELGFPDEDLIQKWKNAVNH